MTKTSLRRVKSAAYGVSGQAGQIVALHHNWAGDGKLYASRYSLAGVHLETIGFLTHDDPLSDSGPWSPGFTQLVSADGPRIFFMTSIEDPLGTLIVWNLADNTTVKLTPLASSWSDVSDGAYTAFRPPIFDRVDGRLWWVQFRNLSGDRYEWSLWSASPDDLTPLRVGEVVEPNPVHEVTSTPWNFAHTGYLWETGFSAWLTDESYRLVTYQRFIDAYPGISSWVAAPRFVSLPRSGSAGSNLAVPAYWGGDGYEGSNLIYPFGIQDPANPGDSLTVSPVDHPQYLSRVDDVPEVSQLSGDLDQGLGFGSVASLAEDGARVSIGLSSVAGDRLVLTSIDGSSLESIALAAHPDAPTANLVGAFFLL